MTYSTLKTALEATKIQFKEGAWRGAESIGCYGVIATDGADDLSTDNAHGERKLTGTVDYFSRPGRGGGDAALIERAMESAGVGWRLESVQYESSTGYTHWEWVFRCLPDPVVVTT